MKIIQISTNDNLGGANKVAWNHMCGLRQRGQDTRLLVKEKSTSDKDVIELRAFAQPSRWSTFWQNFNEQAQRSEYYPHNLRLNRLISYLARPRAALDTKLGLEDFHYPATWQIMRRLQPDVIHCHNLHNRYFDLRALSFLSDCVPTFLSLHDEWLMTGHCSSPLTCTRWQTGCGHCPDIFSYPGIQRDATAYNARRKHAIYQHSRLYIITATQWLMRRVEKSILADGICDTRVIPNGIDLSIFRPADKQAARSALRLPPNANILLFAAVDGSKNLVKDHATIRSAIEHLSHIHPDNNLVFASVGQKAEQASIERIGNAEVSLLPYESDPRRMAQYYQAADLYVHAAHADTFPTVILEAMACGTPVVATAVGGIPEQIITPERSVDRANGLLTPHADAVQLAQAILYLLNNDDLRRCFAANALYEAQMRFNLDRQIQDTLSWYEEVYADRLRHQVNR